MPPASTYRHHKKASSFGLLATAATAAVLSVSSFTTTFGGLTMANAFSASTTDDSPATQVKRQRATAASINDEINKEMRASMPDPTDPDTKGTLECNACLAVAHEMFVYMYDLKTSRGDAETAKKKESSGASNKKNNKKKSHISYSEWVERMEEVCPHMAQNYGLKVDEATGRPTLEFASNTDEAAAAAAGIKTLKGGKKKNPHRQIAGGWIQNILTETCARISDNYENEIIRFMESSAVPATPYSSRPEDNEAMGALQQQVIKAENDLQHLMCVDLDQICWTAGEEEVTIEGMNMKLGGSGGSGGKSTGGAAPSPLSSFVDGDL